MFTINGPLKPVGGHCPECEREVRPIRPPFPAVRCPRWTVPSLASLLLLAIVVLFNGVASWAAVGLLLWRNCKAICPDCGRDPVQGGVGWNRESVILWTAITGCIAYSLWTTFYFVLLIIWMFTLLLE